MQFGSMDPMGVTVNLQRLRDARIIASQLHPKRLEKNMVGLQAPHTTVPIKTQLSNFLGTPGEDYFKGNPKSLNFYFLVIWWGKTRMSEEDRINGDRING